MADGLLPQIHVEEKDGVPLEVVTSIVACRALLKSLLNYLNDDSIPRVIRAEKARAANRLLGEIAAAGESI